MKIFGTVLLCALLVGGTYSTASGQNGQNRTELSYKIDVDVGTPVFEVKNYEMARFVFVQPITNHQAQVINAWPQANLIATSKGYNGYGTYRGHEPVGWRPCTAEPYCSQSNFNAVFKGRGTGGPGLIRY